MGKKKQASGLGKSIIRDRFGKQERKQGDSFLHTAQLQDGYDWGRLNLQSVTEQNNLDEFLATAELAGTEFTAEKLNIKFVSQETGSLPHAEELKTIKGLHKERENLLRIPRRPRWSPQMSASEVDQNERMAFLDWRRSLASVQDDERIIMTPYEKNLDFWRQLWRVIERSDVVVQIVDARNPLLFYCADLEAYVKEVGNTKSCLVLINKADFLSKQQREIWADHFTRMGIKIAFWSAVDEAARQESEAKQEKVTENVEGLSIGDEETANNIKNDNSCAESNQSNVNVNESGKYQSCDGSETNTELKESCENFAKHDKDLMEDVEDGSADAMVSSNKKAKRSDNSCDVSGAGESCDKTENLDSQLTVVEPSGIAGNVQRGEMAMTQVNNTSDMYTGPELLELFRSFRVRRDDDEGLTTIGMVGYPNVGKSSTINAILKMKKVPVSATPGRTKHFQTLYVDPTLMLCDCPGLVFPSFVNTQADLVLAGILPIDQMRDSISPMALLCQKIPRLLLEATYGICIPKPGEGEDAERPPTAHELLNTYGAMRGFMTNRGLPDGPRSARYLLKDYVNGKLLFCQPPEELSEEQFNEFYLMESENDVNRPTTEDPVGQRRLVPSVTPSSVDSEFFRKEFSQVHTRRANQGAETGLSRTGGSNLSETSMNQKPSKKHNNRNKKEKLRRVYGHLDK